MKLGVLFSGGKDSTYAAYLEKKKGNELACLISLESKNPSSYMFHTPNIDKVKKQATVMNLPIVIKKTKGEKEKELIDLKQAIASAKEKYALEGIVTGALHSDYQAQRIQKICDELDLQCINPLWHKNEIEYLEELIQNKFKVMIVGVAAYPLNESWLGKIIDEIFIAEAKTLQEKFKIHPAGEGGEFETFVLNCPLFSEEIIIKSYKDFGENNAWKRELILF